MVDFGESEPNTEVLRDNNLKEIRLWYDIDRETKEYVDSAGVEQGSVLSPLLLNIAYNDVHRFEFDTSNCNGISEDSEDIFCYWPEFMDGMKNLKETLSKPLVLESLVHRMLMPKGLEFASLYVRIYPS